MLFRSDTELIAASARVVYARVVEQHTTWSPAPHRRIYTVSTFAVIEDFTGAPGDTLEVWELGGTMGNETLYVGGQTTYRVGEDVLVCLERGPYGLRSVAMGFSKFDVARRGASDGVLTRDVRQTMVVGGVVPAHERSLAEFRALAAGVVHRPSRRAAIADPQVVTAAEPYTKLAGEPGWRWREADLGEPIIFFKNTSAPPPLVTGDAVPEIQTALSAWTAPTSASIILQYGGTTNESSIEGGWTSIPPNSGLITFEDPNNEMAGAVLALGGGSASSGTGGTVSGIPYNGFDSAFVIFQNAADLPASFRQSLNFTRVLTHELGHAIGFGHTQSDGSVPNPTSNIMYASCCFAETPTPPALGHDDLLGLNTVYPAGAAAGPTMMFDKTALRFGAVTSGNSFVWNTSAQTVRLGQAGAGAVTWTATSTRPWLQVSPASGTGPAILTVSITPSSTLPASGTADAAISLSFEGAANTPGPIAVGVNLTPVGLSSTPIGVLETPLENSTGVTGAVPFTGWTLDDVEVVNVTICRQGAAGETPNPDARCGGTAQIFVGTGLFIDGARPDVQASFPSHPLNSRAGWGFMVLTNMLPLQGNGTFRFSAFAFDREGHVTLLGIRTITCDNRNATKPFGTIDTPTQGGIASGANYVNFGWALTPQPKTIPTDGSTIAVLVDGQAIGRVTYNNFRPDIASAFPGLNNTNGAVGFRTIDTTLFANGLHTISWVVSDDAGAVEGIGSRYFTVENDGAAAVTAAETASLSSPAVSLGDVPLETQPVFGRRGWDPATPWRAFNVGAAGRAVIRGEEVDRLELWLGEEGRYTGYLRVGETLAPLPVGSRLDAASGRFTWAPGVGFVGTYDLVFVRGAGGHPSARRDVRVILAPKGSGHVGTQVEIDTPRVQQIDQPFLLGGWAADLDAAVGTGVDTLHVWAYPIGGSAPIFLGAANDGGARPDVASVHGDQFRDAGFGLTIQGLPAGTYDLAVFPWSNVTGGFAPPKVVRISVR